MSEIIISKIIEKDININENIRGTVIQRAEAYKIGLVKQVELVRRKLNTDDPEILQNINPSYCEYLSITNTPKICVSMKEFREYPKTQELIHRAVKTARSAVDQYYNWDKGLVDFILLVGGSSHLPFIETALSNHFKNDALTIKHPKRDKQHLVVAGAAIIADKLDTPGSGIADVIPLSFGFSKCIGQAPNSTSSIVDLVYVIDATGTMDEWIEAVKLNISTLITDITQQYPKYTFRFGGVAYRDFGDINPPHIESQDFTDIDTFINWVGMLKADGCGDPCYAGGAEDVFTGLETASELAWSNNSALKLVIHVCDRPPHNTIYHNNIVPDEWPNGHDSRLDDQPYHKIVLRKLNDKGIVLMIAKLTDYLEIMIEKFRSFASEIGMKIYDKPIKNASQLLAPSEDILLGELGDIKLANEETSTYVKGEKNSGKYECGLFDVIVPKNERYGRAYSRQYCTHNPEDTEAKFQAFEGDYDYVKDNYWLSNITIKNVPKGSCETSTINVTWYIDKDGIATITAELDNGETICDVESCSISLNVLSNDGALTLEEIIEQRKPMINWFSSDSIKTVLSAK
eukprot:525112_1